jgi:hypothetical protein
MLVWTSGALADATSLTLCINSGGKVRAAVSCKAKEKRFEAASNTALTALQSQVTTLQGQVSALQPQGFAALQDQVADLQVAVTTLHAVIATQQTSISNLEALLAGVSRTSASERDTLLFSGMNLQVVNGSGFTDNRNSLGNIILGYNTGAPAAKTGSHNLVIGDGHTYDDVSGIVTGLDNSLTGQYSAVLGGQFNSASGFKSFAAGGVSNSASGFASFAAGGQDNTASGIFSFVSGLNDTASGLSSFVAGGVSNKATGSGSFAVGDVVTAGPNSCANIYNTIFGTC